MMTSLMSQQPWAVKIADTLQVSGGWRAVSRIDIASSRGPVADPWERSCLGHLAENDDTWLVRVVVPVLRGTTYDTYLSSFVGAKHDQIR